MLFVFPGETAAILVACSPRRGGVSLTGIVITVVLCAIVGDSVGYEVGARWGRKILRFGPLRKREKGVQTALDMLNRRGPIAVFVARFSAFLRAMVPGLAGMSDMSYPLFLASNATGGICWGILYVLLGYFVGQQVEQASGAPRPTSSSRSLPWSSSSSTCAVGVGARRSSRGPPTSRRPASDGAG